VHVILLVIIAIHQEVSIMNIY